MTTYLGQVYEITQASEKTQTKYIFIGGKRICSKADNGEIRYYHTDHLGSFNIITNETGQQIQLLEYTPYGKTWRQEGETDISYKFTGEELDSSTGLYYYGARYYDPELGRFISSDPTVYHPYDPQDLNRYAYCRDNPIVYIDPTGLGWDDIWDKIKGVVEDTKERIKSYIRHPGDYLERKVWEPLKTAGISFVFSGFNPVAAIAAYSAHVVLDTGEGRQIQRRGGREFFDDVLGMRPKAAYIWLSVTLHIAATLAFEGFYASMLADSAAGSRPYDPDNPSDAELTNNPKGYDPYEGRIPRKQ